jgi:hypothetical protein
MDVLSRLIWEREQKETRKRHFLGKKMILQGAAGPWMQFEDIRHQMGAVREEHERERK